jgi:hypothetical protein
MKDNKILTLEEKQPGVNYVALFHGQINGARGDNGLIIQGETHWKPSVFKNFDIVMMGDIHEYQTFEKEETMIIDESELDKYKKEGWEVVGYEE